MAQLETARRELRDAIFRVLQRSVGPAVVELDCQLARAPDFPARAQRFEHLVFRAFDVELEHVAFGAPGARQHLAERSRGDLACLVSGSLLVSHTYAGQEKRAVRTTSLAEMLSQAGRDECDVLKLDIEGAEYAVLEALCRDGAVRRVRELLVEFHHHCTDRTFDDTLKAVRLVEASGFRLCHAEDRNAMFLRRDFVHAG